MFRTQANKDWLMKMVELDGDGFINAGGIRSENNEANEISNSYVLRKALAKFVELCRRKMKLSQVDLAEKTGINAVELCKIEDGVAENISPHVANTLADVFEVPQQSLRMLAGLTSSRNKELDEGVDRFLSDLGFPIPLQKDEEDALNSLVHALQALADDKILEKEFAEKYDELMQYNLQDIADRIDAEVRLEAD